MPSQAKSGHCALARANRVFCTDKKHIRTENAVMDKSKSGLGGFLKKVGRLRRVVFFPRPKPTIRADGFSSAQHRNSATTGTRFKSPRIERGALSTFGIGPSPPLYPGLLAPQRHSPK